MSKIYEYKGGYEEYIEVQKKTTDRKYGRLVYVKKHTIEEIFNYFKNNQVKSILCHGTRSGEEQKLFKDYFKCDVMGSELSEKAINAEMTTIWDFNKVNPDWIGKHDLIYSNSFDHCITPKETLKVWKNQLSPNGRLLIDWSDHQNSFVIESDPFAATENEIIDFASQAGMNFDGNILKNKSSHRGTVLIFKKK